MPLITANQLPDCDYKLEQVQIPEWGHEAFIYVREMNALDFDKYEGKCLEVSNDYSKMPGLRSLLASLTACDDKGNKLFTQDQLDKANRKAIEKILVVAKRLNALSIEETEDIEKN